MSRLLLTVSFCGIILLPAWASAEEPKEKIKGPITVTSETLTADNKNHNAIFEKNVIAKTTDMTIHADLMLVYYKEQGGDVTKIEAKGNVKIYRDAKVITAHEATYFAEEEKVVFTGNPRAIDGGNVVTGTKITYYTKDDRSVVENSKVILKNKQD